MKYKGIIFDLDGVICSTDEYHCLAWKALADRLGIDFNREINNRLRGVSRMASLEIVLDGSDKHYTDAEKAGFAEEKNTIYRELLGRMSPCDLSDEVRDTLVALRGKGLKLAIGSSSRNTPYILERIGLSSFFDADAGIEAAVNGGFDAAAIGDARDDARAKWHLDTFSDLLTRPVC